jgi:hypothetical protein
MYTGGIDGNMKTAIKDEILEETWKIKDGLAAKYDYDVDAMFRAMREGEKRSGHKLVSFVKPKRKADK